MAAYMTSARWRLSTRSASDLVFPGSDATLEELTGRWIGAQLGDRHPMDRSVELPVTTPVQPMPSRVGGPDRDRSHSQYA